MSKPKTKVGVSKPTSGLPIKKVDVNEPKRQKLTPLERIARKEQSQSIRLASNMGASSSMGGMGGTSYGAGSIREGGSNFYSPQLSTDFLELPQSEREKRELYRFWYNCFPPDATVLLPDGTNRTIDNIKVGDTVLNGFGEETKVVNVFKHEISDYLVKMKIRGIQEEISSTGNHPFLVYRAKSIDCKFSKEIGACKQGKNFICRRTKCNSMNFGKPEFIYAKDLKVGDYVVSPHISKSKDCGLSRDQLRLLGYFASEGCFSYRVGGKVNGVEFSLNIDEADTIALEIQECFGRVYGKKATISKNPKGSTCKVVCRGRDFAEFCVRYCGYYSHSKVLHEDLVTALPHQQLEFLGAYWNGDGCFTDNSYVSNTVSYRLSCQIHQISRRLGFPSLRYEQWRDDRVSKGKTFPAGFVHYVTIPGRYYDFFCNYANFVDGEYTAKSTRVYHISVEGALLHKIEKLENVPYSGFVHNFEVDGEGDRKSYIAHTIATHNTHAIVGSAIDFHTDVPMSKIRLSLPKGKDRIRNKKILHFYENMCKRIRLFQTLYEATHEYWLQGIAYIFAEDHDLTESIPEDLITDTIEEDIEETDYVGRTRKSRRKRIEPKPEGERSKSIRKFVEDNYQGWQRLQILPPEQVKMEVFQYTNKCTMELIPSEKDRNVVLRATEQGDTESAKIADDIPSEISDKLLNGQPIPLNSSPYDDYLCSSFCHALAHKKSGYDSRGISLIERCLRPLNMEDKLRQAQTSIASRAMTPKRVVWGDKMSVIDVEELRDQIDQALQDPDYSIISNFEIHWDEIGARDRLLDLSTEYDNLHKLLYIGLRITESMLTGESSYSGERIHLDVMNTMYLLYREILVDYVENFLFAPVAKKKGFWEEDEFGNKVLLYPKLQFTRLALRDNSDLQDFMFNLYQKGSLPISFILELLNIDSDETLEQLKKDMYTPNDANFNEFLKGALGKAGDSAVEQSDILDIIFKNAGLKRRDDKGDRFGKDE